MICPTAWILVIGLKIEDPPNDVVESNSVFTEMGSILVAIYIG
jgi:hypothetical protein